ncbi:hypothetical protein B0H10DRAFT_2020993 [Mycena sp. CBHHK59/15]|nr:hypothetical protein B0H10DRAFT_2020993 [Mycena sp. CBHHK59/15]
MKPQALPTFFALIGAAAAHNANHHAQLAKRQSSAAVPTVPALSSLTFGMPTAATPTAVVTATPGATAPVSGAPALPSPAWSFVPGTWPDMDKPIDATSAQVQEWMKELDGYNIPDLAPTTDGSCVNDTAAAADAESRGWWTCGGYTRDTDIVACPDKMTWGVSFDDGPSPYTPNLLSYLAEKDIGATFFVVGSRVIEYPDILINEYMAGHEISVHTWSHPHLTSLSNAQIVAELGWTREAIKSVLGVTPTTMRPPYGDIDDRVRAIALAMGLIPIIWTRTPAGISFDTFDWKVAGGTVDGPTSFATFESILGNASTLDTGFCVLEHDLYEITVDLAIGYTLNAAMTHTPPFTLEPIGKCSKIPTTNMYVESNKNASFPFPTPPAAFASSNSSAAASAASASASGKAKVAQGSTDTGSGTSGALVNVAPLLLAGLAVLGSAVLL